MIKETPKLAHGIFHGGHSVVKCRVAGTAHNKQLAGIDVKDPIGWHAGICTGDDPGPWRLTFRQHSAHQMAVVLPVVGQ